MKEYCSRDLEAMVGRKIRGQEESPVCRGNGPYLVDCNASFKQEVSVSCDAS